MGGELLHTAPLQPCAEAPSGQCPPCSTGMGHPLGMAPCAEAPHPLSFIRSVGFYPSFVSTFPANYCKLHGLVSLLRAITLINNNTKSSKHNIVFLYSTLSHVCKP